jgi:hypothetical protein
MTSHPGWLCPPSALHPLLKEPAAQQLDGLNFSLSSFSLLDAAAPPLLPTIANRVICGSYLG